jgi:hypothetical protein
MASGRVEALALEGYSRQPLLDACREIQRVGGAADDQQIGLFRPGRETPSPRSPDFSKISDLLTHRFQTASARFWGACPLRKTARALQTQRRRGRRLMPPTLPDGLPPTAGAGGTTRRWPSTWRCRTTSSNDWESLNLPVDQAGKQTKAKISSRCTSPMADPDFGCAERRGVIPARASCG